MKYRTEFLLSLLFFLMLCPVLRVQAAPKISLSNGLSSKNLTDDSYYTNIEFKSGEKITITEASAVKHLYIMWDFGNDNVNSTGVKRYSGKCGVKPWTLVIDGTEFDYGTHGYMHEYIKLPVSGEKLEILIPNGGASIAEIYLIETEEVPDYVQIWEDSFTSADILLISTHSDDEIFFFGATIPYYTVERNMRVQVVYFTYHTEKARNHESLNVLYYCGVRHYPVFGTEFIDKYSESLSHAMTFYDNDKVQKFLVEQYRRFRPNVVLTHDLNGEYGHGQHMLVAKYATEGLEIAADATRYTDLTEKYGTWDVPKIYLHLYEKNPIYMDWEFNMPHYDNQNAWDVIATAFRKYDSQMKYYTGSLNNMKKHSPSPDYDCRKFGLYRTLVGPDTGKCDFLENIKPIEYKDYIDKYSAVREITHGKKKNGGQTP